MTVKENLLAQRSFALFVIYCSCFFIDKDIGSCYNTVKSYCRHFILDLGANRKNIGRTDPHRVRAFFVPKRILEHIYAIGGKIHLYPYKGVLLFG